MTRIREMSFGLLATIGALVIGEAMVFVYPASEVVLCWVPWKVIDPLIEALTPPHYGLHGFGDAHFVRWMIECQLWLFVQAVLIGSVLAWLRRRVAARPQDSTKTMVSGMQSCNFQARRK